MAPQRQKASALNDGFDFNQALLGEEKGGRERKKITSENQFGEQKGGGGGESSLVAGSKREQKGDGKE